MIAMNNSAKNRDEISGEIFRDVHRITPGDSMEGISRDILGAISGRISTKKSRKTQRGTPGGTLREDS